MPRDISSATLTALQASILYPAIFVSAAFSTSTIYVWSGVGSTTWNSQTWTGLGSLLGVTTPEDSSTVEAKGLTITLSGFDATLLPAAMTEFELGLPVSVYLGLQTSIGGSLIDTPITSWSGRMDQPTIEINGTEGTLSINCETRLMDMNISVERRYDIEDSQMTYPNDLGFQFINSLQERTLYWGGYANTTNNI